MSDIEHDDEAYLAAEYVLGVLDARARARAIERIASDPAFRAEVESWEQRLSPMLSEATPTPPPPDLWNRIERSITGEAKIVPFPVRVRLWDRVGVWRLATAASVAAAAVLAFVAVRPAPPPPPTPPVLTATLASSDGKSLYVATIDRSRGGMTVVPTGAVQSGGRTPELWIIPVGGKPLPVGLLSGQAAMSVRTSSTVLSVAITKATLAVSLEPPGGSPTGAPTGPVIASGIVKSL